MNPSEVPIQRGFPERLRDRAAEIFDEAFAEKFSTVIPDHARRLAFLARTLRSDHCLVALEGEELLGLVGLNTPRGELAGEALDTDDLGLSGWRESLGLVGMVRAAALLGLFYSHKAKPDELYIDYIAVSATARGRGVGKRLLAEARRVAQAGGFDCVRLDVVDTNPRAQALYEREGYKVIHEEKLGFMSRLTGFRAVYTMELRLDQQSAEKPL
jgi:ribosomal protein S18 acetylase RimI-like enzyme